MSGIENIICAIDDCTAVIGGLRQKAEDIDAVCAAVVDALKSGRKVLTAGNGGSAAEAMHMSEELVGRFRGDRVSLPAVSLTADGTALTCIGNDYGFDAIFSRQVEGLGKVGDVLVVFSTSGNSVNLVRAVEVARARGLVTIGLLGRDGGKLGGMCDLEVVVAGEATERIQEAHQLLLHIILDRVEREFIENEDI